MGGGLIVVNQNTINGGDFGYLYRGSYATLGDKLSSTIKVTHYNPSATSIFGPLKEFDLTLSGQAVGDTFTFNGSIAHNPSMQIKIAGKRIADLASC
jgi:hypothetical protein